MHILRFCRLPTCATPAEHLLVRMVGSCFFYIKFHYGSDSINRVQAITNVIDYTLVIKTVVKCVQYRSYFYAFSSDAGKALEKDVQCKTKSLCNLKYFSLR